VEVTDELDHVTDDDELDRLSVAMTERATLHTLLLD